MNLHVKPVSISLVLLFLTISMLSVVYTSDVEALGSGTESDPYDDTAEFHVYYGSEYWIYVGTTVTITSGDEAGAVPSDSGLVITSNSHKASSVTGTLTKTGQFNLMYLIYGRFQEPDDGYTVILNVVAKSHTVSFSSEGSVIHAETVEPNAKVQSYTPPAREGYTFDGWYADESLETPFDFGTSITSNITLYAKWIENPVIITFMVGEERHSTLAVPRGSVGVVYTPLMVTGVFAGWYYDADFTEKYDATRVLDGDITLYALGVPPLIFTSEPNATANIQQVNTYNMFFFDATDSSGRYQIEWDFGDGNTSTEAIAYNTYSAPGLYTVTLKITNLYGETSIATYDVLVKDPAGGGDNDLRLIIIALLCILGGGLVIRRFL